MRTEKWLRKVVVGKWWMGGSWEERAGKEVGGLKGSLE